MRKGTAIPEQAFEIQHALADVAVPCLVHAQHAVHALDGTTGSYRMAQELPDLFVCLLPVRRETLAQDLLHDDQGGGVCLLHAVRAADVLMPVPQASHGLASQRLWH